MLLQTLFFMLNVQVSFSILYPQFIGPSWSVANPSHIYCPRITTNYDASIHTKVADLLLLETSIDDHIETPGYLCHKTVYTVTCEENFVGAKTVTYHVIGAKVKKEECLEAIEEYKEGEQTLESFPAPVCHYMEKTDTSSTVITVSPHSVLLDPYTMLLIDPIFVTGRSKGNFSNTIHQDVVWVRSSVENIDVCKIGSVVSGFLFRNVQKEETRDPKNLSIQLDTGRVYHLEGSCSLMYCGENGIRLPSGEWLNVQPVTTSVRLQTFIELSPCKSELLISIDHNHGARLEDISPLSAISHVQCLNTLSKLLEGSPVSQYDISFLVQTTEGPGVIYWLKEGTLLQSRGNYLEVTLNSKDFNSGVIGSDKDGHIVIEQNRYRVDPSKELYYLPNGFTITNNELITPPGLILTSTLHNLLLHPTQLVPIHHPIINTLPTDPNILPSWKDLSTNSTMIPWLSWDGSTPWWLNWKIYVSGLLSLVTVILSIFISLKLTICLCKNAFKRKGRKQTANIEIQEGDPIPLAVFKRHTPQTNDTYTF
ncbi:glycoprotein [Wuhan Louse Fly Virus 9]|uniref:Glycoprotein n=1 Tax=Wuhan Louse Fly Virus 9 TaxID=1608123 RepID=A0A0B5KRS6_9RHAB|nr:glycoprotein [Wuhan Louse Fly Virus 9]AJG39206.1 glycoprotein [Wuhan Louse Fly Virus 9]